MLTRVHLCRRIIEGAAHGAGRGKEVIAVARSADAILIVLDAGKETGNRHREILERELETVGIRLNQRPPDVTLSKRKTGGGIRFASTVPQPQLGPEPEKLVSNILKEYRIVSADVLAREGEPPSVRAFANRNVVLLTANSRTNRRQRNHC